MSRFEELARLKEQEKQATPGPWKYNYNGVNEIYSSESPSESRAKTIVRWRDDHLPLRTIDTPMLTDLRNAAPWLLAIAEAFQPGDSDLLTWMLTGCGDFDERPDTQDKINNLLMRLQAAAESLEGDHD